MFYIFIKDFMWKTVNHKQSWVFTGRVKFKRYPLKGRTEVKPTIPLGVNHVKNLCYFVPSDMV